MNNLNIICFLSAARTESFSITARELSMTQQAVSRNIHKLEHELGFPLFYRDYHTVRLTKAGKAYCQVFSGYVRDLAAAARIWENADASETLRVGCGYWTGLPERLIPILSSETAVLPRIRTLQADDNEISRYLRTGEMDVAIVPRYLSRYIGAECSVTELFELPLYIVIESGHPLISQVTTPDLLRSVPHLTAVAGEPDRDGAARRVCRECDKLDYRPQTVNVLPNIESVYTETLMGNGVTFLPENKTTACRELVLIPLPRTVTISAVMLNRCENPYARRFIRYLTDSLEDVK